MTRFAQQGLMLIFRFTADDLACNQQGFLSRKQKRFFIKDGLSVFLVSAVAAVVLLACVIFSPYRTIALSPREFSLVALALGLIFAFGAWFFLFSRAVAFGGVEKITGTPSVRYRPGYQGLLGGAKGFYVIEVNGARLTTRYGPARVFQQGAVYTFYYSTKGKRVLSVEKVGDLQ